MLLPSAGNSGTIDDNSDPGAFTDKGYYKFPNGLIMQWGRIDLIELDPSQSNSSQGYGISYSFPIKFPNKCISVLTTDYYKKEGHVVLSNCGVGVKWWNTSTFVPYIDMYSTSSADKLGCNWLAIGY